MLISFNINITSATEKVVCRSINEYFGCLYYRHFANMGMHCVIASNTNRMPKAPIKMYKNIYYSSISFDSANSHHVKSDLSENLY